MAERNPLDLYRKHFGFVGLPCPGTRAEQARVDILRSADIQKRDAATIARQSAAPAHYLGTPIFMPVTLDGFTLPFEPLVEISVSKSIVRTPLAGYDGTVKENMGLDDYAIAIRGVVLNEDSDDYPETQVLQLRNLFKKKQSLDIVCPLLGLFNITRIALENLRLPAEEGVLHYQPYKFTGYSDFDAELLLRDDLEKLLPTNVLVQR
ncbi:DUF6046 domain-containing protein [Hymenobacter yonginensis]|uniref:DUF6046 domain-containing protein n=1 Tax=Hymenobacter yonginensis TaxID=748197 RepID=A0ABY7PR20_9BACT|nr:DUF6046 domain-containing protein [Hymenobacter yonginensis]WBO85230.1 DUF6046 domain-containing protein [Hymenobacter yonginensis]